MEKIPYSTHIRCKIFRLSPYHIAKHGKSTLDFPLALCIRLYNTINTDDQYSSAQFGISLAYSDK